MSLPAFTVSGDLPAGIHQATLPEVIQRFGATSAQRLLLAQRLEQIYRISHATNQLARFVIFGSFVTSKHSPDDVDVFMIMEDTFDIAVQSGETRWVFEHQAAQHHLDASVFWLRRGATLGDEQAAIAHWQIKRDGGYRGIVEIVQEQS